MKIAASRNVRFHVAGSASFQVATTVPLRTTETANPTTQIDPPARIHRLRPNTSGTATMLVIWLADAASRVPRIARTSNQ